MENLLLKYMDDRLKELHNKPVERRLGPVVTISRETGCPGNAIAAALLKRIRAEKTTEAGDWKVVNKEILYKSAQELSLPPDKIEYVLRAEQRKWIDEILAAATVRYYKTDQQIRKTITGVIRTVVEEGNVVLVGAGGVAFTRGRENALNIFLHAPREWRLARIIEFDGKSPDDALHHLEATDKERRAVVDHFWGGPADNGVFDVDFNCSAFSIDEVAAGIYYLMHLKKII